MVRFCGCGTKVDHVDLFVPNLTRIAQISGKPSILHLDEVDLYTGVVTCKECAPFLGMMGQKFISFDVANEKLRRVKEDYQKKKRREFFGVRKKPQEVERVSV